jgi:hypothetical protein
LLAINFDPEDGEDIFLRGGGLLSTDYTALYSKNINCRIEDVAKWCAS